MTHVRRLAPLLSLVLATLIGVQTTDLLACADEAAGPDRTHVDGQAAATAHPTPAPGADHDDGVPHEETPGAADCLCHVVFTPTGHLPEVASAPVAPPPAYAPYRAYPVSAEPRPLDHVPLA